MPTLERDSLVFRFPQIEKKAKFSIEFQRTLRIPDSEKTYSLPPGLGRFPVRHAEDFSSKLPQTTNDRGGVILPMWQSEAMWISFHNEGPDWGLNFPVAIKIAAGKINAVTGEPWRSGLHRNPQDYVVSPDQPWLDGFAVEKGVIRQFIAMPLGEGYSVEEQLTRESEWGGLQIAVAPMKASVWEQKLEVWRHIQEERKKYLAEHPRRPSFSSCERVAESSMGLAAGGKMRQEIYSDKYNLEDWDFSAAERVFVTLVHAKDWLGITGEAALDMPPSASEYTKAGLPWFEYYGKDQTALPGGEKLANIKSVSSIFKKMTGANLPDSGDIAIGKQIAVGPNATDIRLIRATNTWEK